MEWKLLNLLWESMSSWYTTVEDWYYIDFDQLDVEEVTSTTMRTIKNIVQLEKGLPDNNILPNLRRDVEMIKDKLPVLSYLRNPNLRTRHWQKIEGVLNYKFKSDEPLTFHLLETLGAFIHSREFMEISGAASSEASLEALLKKIDLTWESLEFIVVPYKDVKDVYILGSLEEIQIAMDESYICLQTVASSRHVGPIKPRVDEWVRQLELFTKTLVRYYSISYIILFNNKFP